MTFKEWHETQDPEGRCTHTEWERRAWARSAEEWRNTTFGIRHWAMALLGKLAEVAEYQAVREGFMVGHGMPYAGPTYSAERDALKAALERWKEPE